MSSAKIFAIVKPSQKGTSLNVSRTIDGLVILKDTAQLAEITKKTVSQERRATINNISNPTSENTSKLKDQAQNTNTNQEEEVEESDNDMVSIQSDCVKACNSPECRQKQPHVHTIKRCAGHNFCPVTEFAEVPDADENTTWPFPMKYELGKTSKQVKNYENMLGGKKKAVQLSEMGLKCVVSDYAIVHWYAQAFKLDVNNLPNQHDKGTLQNLRRLEQSRVAPIPERELNDHIKKSRNKGLVSQSGEIADMIAQELESQAKAKEAKETVSAVDQMRKMKPLVYPITKNVKKFGEFGEPNGGRQKKNRDRDDLRQRTFVNSSDNTSQTSMDVSDARSLNRQSTQNKQLVGSQGGGSVDYKKKQVKVFTDKVKGSTDKVKANYLQGTLIQSEMGGFESITEEPSTINADISTSILTAKGAKQLGQQTAAGKGEKPAQNNRLIARQLQQKRRERSKIDVKNRPYNPYASDGIKNMDNLSRSEIDKLMVRIKRDKEIRKQQQLDAHDKRQTLESTNAQESQAAGAPYQEDKRADDQKSRAIAVSQPQKKNNQSENMFLRTQGQFDISMRARREQQFKDKMSAEYNINVRQGRTYTKFFNRQIDRKDQQKGKQGTCFQYINQFQETQFRPSTTGDYVSESLINKTSDQAKLRVKTPDRQERIPITASLIGKLRGNRRGIATAATMGPMATGSASRNSNSVEINQDMALNSLMNYNNKARQGSNDRHLQTFINRKHRDGGVSFLGRKSTASVTQNVPNLNQSFSEPSSVIIPRISTSQHQTTRTNKDTGIHQSARRRIKEMLDSQYLCQDLRKGRSNTIATNPYGTMNVFPVDHTREVTLTPSLLQDTLTIEQSKLLQSTRTEEEAQIKRVNQVSFMNPKTKLEVNRGEEFDLHSAREVEDDNTSQMIVVRDQNSTMWSNFKNPAKVDLQSNLKKGREDAETAVDDQLSQQTEKKGGYFVTAEDYNFEVQEPLEFFQKELFVKLPLYQPLPVKATIDLDIFKSAEFWLSKGYIIQNRAHQSGNRKNGNEADNVALDYYLSGVKIDPQHYGCIYNAGCCHFFTGKFQNARKWFHLTTLVNPRCPDGYYGKALSCLKLGLYEEALESIVQIDKHEEKTKTWEGSSERTSQLSISEITMQEANRFQKQAVTFLNAVCCKILNRQEEAQYLYSKLKEEIHKKQCEKMIFSTFAVLLVPMQKERNVTEDNVINFSKLMAMYDNDHLYDQSVATNLMRLSQPQTDMKTDKRLNYLSKYLQIFPFLRRIPAQNIENEYIHKMQIIEKKKNDLIIIPPNNQVVIILNGQVVMREHELDTPGDFSIKQQAKSGHIIFAPELDGGNSNQPLVWPVVYSQAAQYALIDRATFDQMWRDSRNRDLEVALSQLNLHLFFKSLSKQTFFKILNEKSKIVKFSPGQLVLPIHHRSPWNNSLFKKYEAKQMAVLEQLDLKNDIGQGGMTVLAFESKDKKRTSSQLKQQQNSTNIRDLSGVQMRADTEPGDVSAKIVNNHILGKGSDKDNKKPFISSQMSSPHRSGPASKTSKNEPSVYEKFTNIFKSDARHQTTNDLDKALQTKKRKAKKKFMLLQKGMTLEDQSDTEDCDQENQGSTANLKAQTDDSVFMPETSFCRPIMLMYSGSARCVNKSFPGVTFVAKRLATGSILGESDSMKCVGIDFFGDVYAESNGLQCLVIEKPDLSLDTFEMKVLKDTLGAQHHELQNMLETRFTELKKNPIKNY